MAQDSDPSPGLVDSVADFRKTQKDNVRKNQAPLQYDKLIKTPFKDLKGTTLIAFALTVGMRYVSKRLHVVTAHELAWDALRWFYFATRIPPEKTKPAIFGFIKRRTAYYWESEKRLSFVPLEILCDQEAATVQRSSSDPATSDRLYAALQQLSLIQRIVVIQKVINGQSSSTIAKELGIPASSVRVHHVRAIARLRRILS